MNEAPRYLLGKTRDQMRPRRCKITRFDVEYVRRWVRKEGFGMNMDQQVRALQQEYPHLGYTTLYEVITNRSWYDATYDRTVALPDAPAVPAMGLLASLFCLIRLLLAPEVMTCTRGTSRLLAP